MTFKEGGAFDFQSTYEMIKEQVWQAAEMAREAGRTPNPGADLEQLPAYEEAGTAVTTSAAPLQQPSPISPVRTNHAPMRQDDGAWHANGTTSNQPPPDEPPPGYEEVQQTSIADNLERSIRDGSQK